MRPTRALAFLQLFERLHFRLNACLAFRSFAVFFLRLLRGEKKVPSLRVANRLTPMSMPMGFPVGGAGVSTSRSVWMATNHLPADSLTVTCLRLPSVGRLFRYLIQPSLGSLSRLFCCSSVIC